MPRNQKINLEKANALCPKCGYLAVIFDFDKPASRNLTETVRTLAHLSRFIIADLTDAKSVPQELVAIVPFLPSVAIKPIIFEGDKTWSMFGGFLRYTWVLPVWRYSDLASVESGVMNEVIRRLKNAWQSKSLVS